MNFQSIKPVEDFQFYLDLAFRRAKEKGEKLRAKKLKGQRLEKSRYIELMKMQVISDTIAARMGNIVENFPSLDALPEFYNELVRLSVDYGQLKKSLGACQWLRSRVLQMFKIYKSKQAKNKQFENVNKLKTEFLGRISSMVKQLKKDFLFLEAARRTMKVLPVVKTGLQTIAIAGFPNVGKTTLLYKMTGSKAEINEYPFTTKGVNVSFIGKGKERIQLLDTPGTLNRFEKMNNIEKVAYLAIKHCAEKIVYVFDLTEEYPIEKQEKLMERLKRDFKLPVVVYLSKEDLVDEVQFKEFKKKHKAISDVKELKEKLSL